MRSREKAGTQQTNREQLIGLGVLQFTTEMESQTSHQLLAASQTFGFSVHCASGTLIMQVLQRIPSGGGPQCRRRSATKLYEGDL